MPYKVVVYPAQSLNKVMLTHFISTVSLKSDAHTFDKHSALKYNTNILYPAESIHEVMLTHFTQYFYKAIFILFINTNTTSSLIVHVPLSSVTFHIKIFIIKNFIIYFQILIFAFFYDVHFFWSAV